MAVGRLFTLPQIRAALPSADALLSRISDAFVAYTAGRVAVAQVAHLNFESATHPGDCCIKSGFVKDGDHFVVKVASGFYNNAKLYNGLSTSQGSMLVFSQRHGQLEAVLNDEGFLTDLRTALAGILAARLLAPTDVECVGIVGAGVIGKLLLEHLPAATACRRVLCYSRSAETAAGCVKHAEQLGYECASTTDAAEVARRCRLIFTATPSRGALWAKKAAPPSGGMCIVAMGADGAGKQELDPELVASADLVVCDSISQNVEFGEVSHAVKQGLLPRASLVELGELITRKELHRRGADDARLTIVDSTGVAAQDVAIAEAAYSQLAKAGGA